MDVLALSSWRILFLGFYYFLSHVREKRQKSKQNANYESVSLNFGFSFLKFGNLKVLPNYVFWLRRPINSNILFQYSNLLIAAAIILIPRIVNASPGILVASLCSLLSFKSYECHYRSLQVWKFCVNHLIYLVFFLLQFVNFAINDKTSSSH